MRRRGSFVSNSSAVRRSAVTILTAAVFATAISGCAGTGRDPAFPEPEQPIVVTEISDADFGRRVYELLTDGEASPERLSLLAGIVRQQLVHANRQFAAGHDQRGMQTVMGAMFLMRAGESRREMVTSEGASALSGAVEVLSARGDEGAARALMMMRRTAVEDDSPEQREIDGHLRNLNRWLAETQPESPIEKLGAKERVAVHRALVEPTEPALLDAQKVISLWIDQAIEHNLRFRQTGRRPTRSEAVEATRALDSGAESLAALHLRHGSALGAAEAIENTSARRVVDPDFYNLLRQAADADTARAWQNLFQYYSQNAAARSGGEIGIQIPLLRGALWGIALEAFRRDPTDLPTARVLSSALIALGLGEVVPAVLFGALGKQPDAQDLSLALELTATALRDDASTDDVASARRTIGMAGPLLAMADTKEMRGLLDPSAASLRFLMASVELRAGNLQGARPYLQAAVEEDPSPSGYTMLAVLERQAKKPKEALSLVDRALQSGDPEQSLLDGAEAKLLAFEIYRDDGQQAEAKEALASALSSVLAARERRLPKSAKARAERLLGRILDIYGDEENATRAFDRALALADSDRSTLSVTMLDIIGRALLSADVDTARSALRQALNAEVDANDLVYGGLWVWLLEQQLGVPSDGVAEMALAAQTDPTEWTQHLADWATGKIEMRRLTQLASNESQRVEAAFYTAMVLRITGDPKATDALSTVAQSGVIDLLEVHLARELIAPQFQAKLPEGVRLP